MNEFAELTKREREIAELIAWGATKKDVANRLFISQRTVENHARNIFEKTGCTKANELSAWWFCTTFHISFDLSPLKRTLVGLFFLAIITPQVFDTDNDQLFIRTARTCRTIRTGRKSGKDNN